MTPRVASLIPSGTEIVCALGMADLLVGRSHCCDYPAWVTDLPILSRPRVDPEMSGAEIDRVVRDLMDGGGSVYDVLLEPLLACEPDVVVTQDHCDACAVSLEDVRAAVACADLAGARLCALHPHDLDGVLLDFGRVAEALGVPERGDHLRARFLEVLDAVAARTASIAGRPRVAMIEWMDPPMIAGGWMPELARRAGATPVLVEDARTFLQVGWDDVAAARPDAVVLLPCGFDVPRTLRELEEGPAAEALAALLPSLGHGCWIVDGDAYFNRPGPRLADSAALLASVLHPDAMAGWCDERGLSFAGAWTRLVADPAGLASIGPTHSAQRTISVPSGSR